MSIPIGRSGIIEGPEGITNPPIDELLETVSSKYALVIYAAKRARQINDYYAQLGEGLLEYVGPARRARPAREAALGGHARDPRRPARAHRGRVTEESDADPGRSFSGSRAASPPTRPARCSGACARPATTSRWWPPRSALEFIGAATFEALSGRPVLTGVFENVAEVEHVALGRRADLVVIAPATADLLSRMAHGRADDLLDLDAAHRAMSGARRPRDAHRDVGAPGDASTTSPPCAAGAPSSSSPPPDASPAPTRAPGVCPSPPRSPSSPASCSSGA